jgi:queuine/archaeosine tRNA-ribosyltransferase
MQLRRKVAMEIGLRKYLKAPKQVQVYLDNGAFYFGFNDVTASLSKYEKFVEAAKPDWKPIPQDYIPFPSMTPQQRRGCFDKTMRVNLDYQHNGYVPVVHIGHHLKDFTDQVRADTRLRRKPWIALGAIVPNLLRKPKALPYTEVLKDLVHIRKVFKKKAIHVFGVGGTATLHLTALLGFDSVDSSGWRNRAARGIIQLPGSGERLVANPGSWRGRRLKKKEKITLEDCQCPACVAYGIEGLRAKLLHGFQCRATHNLWVLLE